MKKKITLVILFVGIACICLFGQQETTIEDVINNPGPFVEEKIRVEGIIEQFIPETSSTNAHYLLKGKYGGIIKVKTDEAEPIQNEKYRVVGTVYIEEFRPFIHERSKVLLIDDLNRDTDGDGVVDIQDNCPLEAGTVENNGCPKEFPEWWIFVIIGAGVLLIVLIIIFIINQNQRKKMQREIAFREQMKRQQEEERTSGEAKKEGAKPEAREEFSTIKLSKTDPKTMKFIPGRLEIQTLEDKGKSFKMAGFPTPEGYIVTIGRKPVTGERAYAHILIDEKFKTVSRLQAELIYRDGKLYVRSIGETNLTQVDGYEIPAGEIVELRPGSLMKIGELDFKYIV